jgi:hypothetical protein
MDYPKAIGKKSLQKSCLLSRMMKGAASLTQQHTDTGVVPAAAKESKIPSPHKGMHTKTFAKGVIYSQITSVMKQHSKVASDLLAYDRPRNLLLPRVLDEL